MPYSKKYLVFILIFSFVSAATAQVRSKTFAVKKFDEYFNDLQKSGPVSGVVQIYHGSTLFYSRSFGYAGLAYGYKNNRDTKFRIASVTKSFTATAIFSLIEKGVLHLTDPISKFFTDSPESWKQVTIHHLLSHTSGLFDYDELPAYDTLKFLPTSPLALVNRFKDIPLNFQPGKMYDYSNSNFVLLGYIIEKASGMKYEHYLENAIFKKIGLRNTGTIPIFEISKNIAEGYYCFDTSFFHADKVDVNNIYATGNLVSTVPDLYKFLFSFFKGSVLKKENVQLMTKDHSDHYGYGWQIDTFYNTPVIGHNGSIDGYCGFMSYLPKQDMYIIFESNLYNAKLLNFRRQLVQIISTGSYNINELGSTIQNIYPPVEIAVPFSILQKYAGRYKFQNTLLDITVDADSLFLKPGNEPAKARAIPIRPDLFFIPGPANVSLKFILDVKQLIATSVLLNVNGRSFVAERVKAADKK